MESGGPHHTTGHGAGATNAQQAHLWALTYQFLWNTLAD